MTQLKSFFFFNTFQLYWAITDASEFLKRLQAVRFMNMETRLSMDKQFGQGEWTENQSLDLSIALFEFKSDTPSITS